MKRKFFSGLALALALFTISGCNAEEPVNITPSSKKILIAVFSYTGNDAALLAERLSPLFVLLAPLGYGLGYTQGRKLRDKINTGIKMGDDRKKRRERKARKQRQRSKSPERLI